MRLPAPRRLALVVLAPVLHASLAAAELRAQTTRETGSEPAGPARAGSVVEIGSDVIERPVESALGWVKFMAAGYRGTADHLGNGGAADAELALGEAIEKSLPAFLQTLPGKKTKVRLNDAVEGTITKVEDGGIVVNVNKADTLVPWGEIDPGKLAAQWIKAKPTAEPEVAALAVMRMLGGDAGDAKAKSGKLTSELGAKLKELLEDWKTVGPELAAARALDAALREKDPAKAVERFRTAWAASKSSKLAAGVAAKAHEQFVLRGEQAFAGDAALKSMVHGKVTTTPARAHPGAGPGGVGMEIEYDFEKDSEGPDFDPAGMNPKLRAILKKFHGTDTAPVPFLVSSSRLAAVDACGGVLPLEFGGDVELDFQGGTNESVTKPELGALSVGFTTPDGSQIVIFTNFSVVEVVQAPKGESAQKKIEPLRPGLAFGCTLKVAGGKVVAMRDGEALEPPPKIEAKGMWMPFVLGAGGCQWYVERMVIRGTATRASLASLARLMAEREAKALFGE
jgi:hypothetical protein